MAASVSPTDLLQRPEADLRGNILPLWIAHAAATGTGPSMVRFAPSMRDVRYASAERPAPPSRILLTYARALSSVPRGGVLGRWPTLRMLT